MISGSVSNGKKSGTGTPELTGNQNCIWSNSRCLRHTIRSTRGAMFRAYAVDGKQYIAVQTWQRHHRFALD